VQSERAGLYRRFIGLSPKPKRYPVALILQYPIAEILKHGSLASTIGMRVAQLDVETVVKASQALSSEIVLSKLIEKLMLGARAWEVDTWLGTYEAIRGRPTGYCKRHGAAIHRRSAPEPFTIFRKASGVPQEIGVGLQTPLGQSC
jgi:hypothetical protein